MVKVFIEEMYIIREIGLWEDKSIIKYYLYIDNELVKYVR